MKRILIAACAAFACGAGLADAGSTSWAGCYLVESDRIEIRRDGDQHYVRAGTDHGEEVRLVMRPATREELERVQWYPPSQALEGLVIDRAAVGTRVVREPQGGTLPLLGMYRVSDPSGHESLLGFFPFAIGPARQHACPAPKPSRPSPWAGCYATLARSGAKPPELFQVRQDGETLYIENGMEGILPTRLVFGPATPSDLRAFAAASAGSAGASIEATGGLALYGVAMGTHYKPAENKGEPRMGFYRVRKAADESLYLLFPFTFEPVTQVPCAANR